MNLNQNRHFISKGWGFEDWIVNKEEYCGKILFFKKGKKCSWHYHNKKDETFYVQSGKLWVGYSKRDVLLDEPEDSKYHRVPQHYRELINVAINFVTMEPGDTLHIPPGTRHYMYGLQDTYMFEFSTQHFEEDSIRVVKGD